MSDADRQRWEARYLRAEPGEREPSRFLTSLDALLPQSGRALDLAGGAGRHGVWLARRGLDVTICDISETALGLARASAERAGVSVATIAVDLELSPPPSGPWDLLVSFDYLDRRLFARWAELLAPRGMLVFVQPTRSNLLRHPKPGSTHLLDDGELLGLLRGLDVLRHEEGWSDEGRHEARLVACRR